MSDIAAHLKRLGSYSVAHEVEYEYNRLKNRIGSKINEVFITRLSPYIKKYQNELEYFAFYLFVSAPKTGTEAEFRIEIVMPYRYPQEQPVPRLFPPPEHEFLQSSCLVVKRDRDKGDMATYSSQFRVGTGLLENMVKLFEDISKHPVFRPTDVYKDIQHMKEECDAMIESFKYLGVKLLPDAINCCQNMSGPLVEKTRHFNPAAEIAVTEDPRVVTVANAMAIKQAVKNLKDSLYSDKTPFFELLNLEDLLGLYEYLTAEELKCHKELRQLAENSA